MKSDILVGHPILARRSLESAARRRHAAIPVLRTPRRRPFTATYDVLKQRIHPDHPDAGEVLKRKWKLEIQTLVSNITLRTGKDLQ
jgi:hypothetical protein